MSVEGYAKKKKEKKEKKKDSYHPMVLHILHVSFDSNF